MCTSILSHTRDFLGGPAVKTLSSSAGGGGSVPVQGGKVPHASQPKSQNIKIHNRGNMVTHSIKTFLKKWSTPKEKKNLKKN